MYANKRHALTKIHAKHLMDTIMFAIFQNLQQVEVVFNAQANRTFII
jgi:hypothetical protein